MPIKILMPSLSPTMSKGNLTRWIKNEGDKVFAGDVVAEIETDKATMEVEVIDDGVLAKIIIPSNSNDVPVNTLIGILLQEEEGSDILDQFIKENSIAKSANFLQEEIKDNLKFNDSKLPLCQSNDSEIVKKRFFISPLASRLAKENKIDIKMCKGTGPNGRIIKKDIDLLIKNINFESNQIIRQEEKYRVVPNTNIRKIIAERLTESKQLIPHFYLSIECNVDKLLEIRKDINSFFLEEEKKIKLSVNDFIVLAVAKSLKAVPEINSSWNREEILYYNNIDISIAVSTEKGLITPIIKNVEQKSIIQLSLEIKELIKKAREGKLTPEEFQGGGFSISNLGMYNIKNFNAIINPPQSSILAVGESSKRPIVIENKIVVATIMDLTLSLDHRVIDGALGAKFLNIFKKFIEKPAMMLI